MNFLYVDRNIVGSRDIVGDRNILPTIAAMEYISEQPLNQIITIFEKSDITNEYNEPTYTKKVVNCAIFQKQRKTINAEGQEILSVSKIAVKNKVSVKSMVFEGETAETTPPFNSQEVKNISRIVNEWQEIEGYWLWL